MNLRNRTSPGAAAFAVLVARHGAQHLATLLGCAEATIRHWATGIRKPSPTWQARLQALDPSMQGASWDGPAPTELAPPPSVPTPAKAPPRPKRSRSVDGCARLEDIIRECDALLAEAREPGSLASYRDRSAVLATKASVATRLSRLRGEDDFSMRKILATPWWREITHVVAEVLNRWAHTEDGQAIARELAEALEALDRDKRES
jgi:hypothetical protein